MAAQAVKVSAKPIIIDPEHLIREKLSHSEHFVFRIDADSKDRLRNSFVILPSSTLNKYAELLVRSMKELSKLRVVFVWMDTDFDTFFDKVAELKVSSLLSKMFRFDYPEQVDRVLHAWCDGLQQERFADARVKGSMMIVKACDLSRYEIDLSDLPVFRNFNLMELQRPQIDRTGTRLIWEKQHIDLDFDTVRYQADPVYKRARDLEALEYYRQYGEAVRQLREAMKHTQESISAAIGVSTRHLSRIENSDQKPTTKLMAKLASAHSLSLEDYLNRLLQICAERETTKITMRRFSKNAGR